MRPYIERLHEAIRSRKTAALVGLDPRRNSLPAALRPSTDSHADTAAAFEEFCRRVIDVVAPLVPAVKPQAAFFEQLGPAGMRALAGVIRHARRAGLIVICDAKRGDIGSTAEAYAEGFLAGADPDAAPWGADALTVNPYLGIDTLEPFTEVAQRRGAGIYVLVRTSNPGSGSLQDRRSDGQTLYEAVADAVEGIAALEAGEDGYGNVGAVVGATYPQELAALRQQMPHVPLLVPGYGSQGGTSTDVAAAFDENGLGALVNSSRGINFAYLRKPYDQQYGEERWEDAVRAATEDMIEDLASNTPAGGLRA